MKKRPSDPAHKATDDILEQLEGKISKEYEKAAREASVKLQKHLSAFEAKDIAKRADLAKGLITEKEYKDWRVGQMMMGKRWEEMSDTLAQDFHNVNRISRSIVNGYMPEVYALNHNYGTFEVEKGALVDTSYTLYDRQTVERLLRDEPDLLMPPGKQLEKTFGEFDAYKSGKPVIISPKKEAAFKKLIRENKDVRWQRGKIQSVTLQSILQGESIPNMAKRIAREMGEINRSATIRYARTATTAAENAGRIDSYKRAEDLGIEMEQEWMATIDMRTRPSHIAMDGERVAVGETFSNGCKYPADPDGEPEEVYNCFVGDTLVATDSDIVRSYKHEYKGELVTIETAAGVKFTCTLNHPILTPSGWVRANRLNKGDDICVTFVGDHHLPRRYPNVNHIHSRIDALHEFANEFGRERVSGLRVNFHGDVPATDVEVITHKGLLRDNRNASEFEEKRKLGFKFSNSTLFSHGALMKHFRRVGTSAFSFICGACEAFSFFGRGLRHSEIHRLRPIALLDAGGMKPVKNNISGYAKFICERFHGAPTVVFADNIIGVNYSTDCTHVYNLQSDNGYYFVNSIISKNGGMYNGIGAIAHNCRCTLRAVVKNHDYSKDGRFERLPEGMTYDDWKARKSKKKKKE